MRNYYKYMFFMALLVIVSLVGVMGYYIYDQTHQPAKDPKFNSIVTSINDIKSDETLYVKVKIDYINVRKTNVVTSENIIGTAIADDIYKVTAIKKGETFYWYYIEDKEGHKGCIPSGNDELFVETIILKKNVQISLSTITDYKGESGTEINPSGSTTTTTTTAVPDTTTTVSTTNNQNKTTTTTKKTTKKTTVKTTTTTTQKTPTTKIITTPKITLRIRSTATPICSSNCEYYLTVEAIAEGGTEPYQYIIDLYKDGVHIAQNNNYKSKMTINVTPGSYSAVARLVGTDLESSMDMEIEA